MASMAHVKKRAIVSALQASELDCGEYPAALMEGLASTILAAVEAVEIAAVYWRDPNQANGATPMVPGERE